MKRALLSLALLVATAGSGCWRPYYGQTYAQPAYPQPGFQSAPAFQPAPVYQAAPQVVQQQPAPVYAAPQVVQQPVYAQQGCVPVNACQPAACQPAACVCQ